MEKFIILDANSILHRAYHALPPLTTKKKERVEALYGFSLLLLKVLREFEPDFICACFDHPAPTFRHKKYKEYKIQRPKTPQELVLQIAKLKELLKAFNIPFFEKEGFEADDLIGTITNLVSNLETIILSGDLDLLQLVTNQTKLYLLKSGLKNINLIDEKAFREKFFNLNPWQLPDFKALRGDLADNIPGVKGIGEKTAIELLLKFKTIENLYDEIEKNSPKTRFLKPKIKESLLKFKSQAILSKELAKINKNVPLNFNLENCKWQGWDESKLINFFEALEFKSLIKRIKELQKIKRDDKLKNNIFQKSLF